MREHLQLMARIANIDIQLAELHEELGDLPDQVREKELTVREHEERIEALVERLAEHAQEWSNIKSSLKALETREKQLSQQQFQVRNNKEFDAITKELEHIKQEKQTIEDGISPFFLRKKKVEAQKVDTEQELATAKEELAELENQLRELSAENEDVVMALEANRRKIAGQLPEDLMHEYDRIHALHNDPVVRLRRSNCSGCYSQIPPQVVVEIRKMTQIYNCENCGRFLYPDDMSL